MEPLANDPGRCCTVCDAVLFCRANERADKFAARMTCGPSCGAKAAQMMVAARKARLVTLCIICNERPRQLDKMRRRFYTHCGEPECRKAIRQHQHMITNVGWPKIEPSYWPSDYFTPHDRDPGDGGVFWRKTGTADRQSYSGSSAAWTAGI